MVLYSSTKLGILKPWGIISNLSRFDLGFWQASKTFYRKFKYREKVLEEFQHLPRFPRKMVLHSSTKFCIVKPWAIFSNHRRFDWGFWQVSISFFAKLKYREKVLEDFQSVSLSQKNGVVFVNQFLHFKASRNYFQPCKFRFRLLTGFKTILSETQI